jgi:hypothetical protein
MPSKPGEEPAGRELIASRTFCSLTIKKKSTGLKPSGKKVREMEKDFFFNSSATSSLNEDNESSEDNNLTATLISKSATFAHEIFRRQVYFVSIFFKLTIFEILFVTSLPTKLEIYYVFANRVDQRKER